MLRQILAGSRYLIVIAVIGSFLASIGVLVDGGLTAVNIMVTTFSHAVFSKSRTYTQRRNQAWMLLSLT